MPCCWTVHCTFPCHVASWTDPPVTWSAEVTHQEPKNNHRARDNHRISLLYIVGKILLAYSQTTWSSILCKVVRFQKVSVTSEQAEAQLTWYLQLTNTRNLPVAELRSLRQLCRSDRSLWHNEPLYSLEKYEAICLSHHRKPGIIMLRCCTPGDCLRKPWKWAK